MSNIIPELGLPDALSPARVPQFRAICYSTKAICQILKCINFVPKVHVRLCKDGIRFMADSARVMQGTAFVSRTLFPSYKYNVPKGQPDPVFQISLPTLLETLQILGTVEATRPKDDYNAMRTNARLRTGPFSPFWGDVTGMCLIDWDEPGSPLIIRLEEAGLRTSIDMNTYESEMPDDIPFDHDHVAFRIIMQARLLNGIMAELATTGPEKLTIGVSRDAPYVTFSGHSDLGDTVVDLARGRRDLLETFYIPPDADEDNVGWLQTYRYDLLRLATDAMRIASKVAFRGDAQGVVSWNFMIDRVSELGKNSFVRFDYVPYARGIDDGDDEAEEDDDDGSPGRDRDDIGF